MKKLLLLNPPSEKIVFRDYYCTKISKSDFYYHPVDLIYLSGLLSTEFDISFLDCIAERLNVSESISHIHEINPEIIVFLIASPSYHEDLLFLNSLKTIFPQTLFIGGGDIYRELKEKAFAQHSFLDAIFLDFSTDELLQFLQNKNGSPVNNIIYRHNDKIVVGEEIHKPASVFDIPVPRWDLVKIDSYSFPYAIREPFATVLTDFGCPYTCSFCPIGTLGFKLRRLETVLSELNMLQKLGVKELLFRDQTFGVNKKRTSQLCQEMINKKLDFTWTAYSRVDVLDEETISWMSKSGCHMVMFGLESASQNSLDKYQKNLKIEQAKKTINICHKYKINTGGWFILGFPEENEKDVERTINYSIESNVDFAVFNLLTLRLGTSLRGDWVEEGVIDGSALELDSSFNALEWNKSVLSRERLLSLQRKAYLKFYLRPNYIVKRIRNIRTFCELKNNAKNGFKVMFKYFRKIA